MVQRVRPLGNMDAANGMIKPLGLDAIGSV
jgi:hypothetical protein